MLEPASTQAGLDLWAYQNFSKFHWLGSVAGPVTEEANARPELEDGLRTGAPLPDVAR